MKVIEILKMMTIGAAGKVLYTIVPPPQRGDMAPALFREVGRNGGTTFQELKPILWSPPIA